MCRVGVVYTETPNWPKMRWVRDALSHLGHYVTVASGADGFAQLSQSCELVVLGHQGTSGRWPNLKPHFPKRRAIVAQVWFDLIARRGGRLADEAFLSPDNHLPLLKACDFVFVKERSRLDEFKGLGINARYLDQGVPVDWPEISRENPPRWDVLFFGQNGPAYAERNADIAKLACAGFKVAMATNTGAVPKGVERLEWCHPDKLHELASQASLVLSADLRHDEPGYWSDRFWLALGMGACVLRRYSPGLPDGPFVVYRDHHELIERTTRLLAPRGAPADTPGWSPEVARLGQEARKWSLQNHSLSHRCAELIRTAVPIVREPAD